MSKSKKQRFTKPANTFADRPHNADFPLSLRTMADSLALISPETSRNPRRKSVADRFDEKWILDPETGCFRWHGRVDPDGYGMLWKPISVAGRRVWSAHRWSYERAFGPIPAGLQVDHLCRVRNCVNPEHLEAVTPRENVLRGKSLVARNAQKTHCVREHELAGTNLHIRPDGSRSCRACSRARVSRNYYAAKRLDAIEMAVAE